MSPTKPVAAPQLTDAERKLVEQIESAAGARISKPATLLRQLMSTPLLVW